MSVGWVVLDNSGHYVQEGYHIIKQTAPIPQEVIKIHGITDEIAEAEGASEWYVLASLRLAIEKCEYVIAHNIEFDYPILESAFFRNDMDFPLRDKKKICTMQVAVKYFNHYNNRMKLTDMYVRCFYGLECSDVTIEHHNALIDAKMAAKSFVFMGMPEDNLFSETYGFVLYRDFAVTDKDCAESELYNKHVVVTGVFHEISRDELEYRILEKGGILRKGLSKQTNFVFLGSEPDHKSEKYLNCKGMDKNSSYFGKRYSQIYQYLAHCLYCFF